jgi:hypothetical protein
LPITEAEAELELLSFCFSHDRIRHAAGQKADHQTTGVSSRRGKGAMVGVTRLHSVKEEREGEEEMGMRREREGRRER